MKYRNVIVLWGYGWNPYLLLENRSSADCRFLSGRLNIRHTCIRPWNSLPQSKNDSSWGSALDRQANCRSLLSVFCLPLCFYFGRIIQECVKSGKASAASAVGRRCEGAMSWGWWWNACPGGGDRKTGRIRRPEDWVDTPWRCFSFFSTSSDCCSTEIELNLKAIPKVKIKKW